MKINRICTVFFSPTGGTKRAACALAEQLAALLGIAAEYFSLTLPEDRQKNTLLWGTGSGGSRFACLCGTAAE